MRPRLPLILLLLLLAALAGCRDAPDPARDLERRLLAPCCWRQPLRDHESPVARRLRAEIAARVAAGEPPRAIEADLVARHGEQIRALPEGGDPTWVIGAVTGVAALATLGLILIVLRRRVRGRATRAAARPSAAAPTAHPAHPADEDARYADLLDDELLAID